MTTESGKTIAGWEDPPVKRLRYDWQDISAKLKKKPGTWAKIFDRDRTSLAVALRSGSIAALRPELGFEVRTSNNTTSAPRTCTLHMRYVPERDQSREKD